MRKSSKKIANTVYKFALIWYNTIMIYYGKFCLPIVNFVSRRYRYG